jgi:hypothetical protein
MITNVYGLHAKYPLFLSHINETSIFWTDFRKILKYQISWKSVQWEPSCPMRAGRRTDIRRTSKSLFAILRTRLKSHVPPSCHDPVSASKQSAALSRNSAQAFFTQTCRAGVEFRENLHSKINIYSRNFVVFSPFWSDLDKILERRRSVAPYTNLFPQFPALLHNLGTFPSTRRTHNTVQHLWATFVKIAARSEVIFTRVRWNWMAFWQ